MTAQEGSPMTDDWTPHPAPPQEATARPDPPFIRLSELVNALPVEQRARWLSYYRAAVKAGEVTAYVLAEKFSYDSGNAKDKKSQVSRYEEAVASTPDFQTWLQQTRHRAEREVRRSMSAGAGRIAVTMDELLSGALDLPALAQANRNLKTPDVPRRKKIRRQATPGGRRRRTDR